MEKKEPKDKKHESNWSQPSRTKTANTTRATRYVEGREKDKPEEKMFETKHDKATNTRQHGEDNNSGFKEEPKSITAKGRSPHPDKNTQPRSNTKHQQIKTITSRDIMSMVRKGEMTYGEAETKFEKLGKEFQRKITKRNIMNMMDSGELTMEESEIELRNLESREKKDNNIRNDKHNNKRNETARPDPIKAPEQQLPKNIHATIVPSIHQVEIQKPKQPIYGGKDQIAPKYNNEEKNGCDGERETLPGINKDESNNDKDKNEKEVIPNKGVKMENKTVSTTPIIRTNMPMIQEHNKHTIYTLNKNTEWNNDEKKAATDKTNHIAPKCNNKEKNECDYDLGIILGKDEHNENNDTKGDNNKNSSDKQSKSTLQEEHADTYSTTVDGEDKDKHGSDNSKYTSFTLNKNNKEKYDKEKEITPNRNIGTADHANERGVEENVKATPAPLKKKMIQEASPKTHMSLLLQQRKTIIKCTRIHIG